MHLFKTKKSWPGVEIAKAGARLVLAPDWKSTVWTQEERKNGQAWGLKTIESFHTHGTPPVVAS
jgi:catechol 2,3-dioxygenase